jgi:hypothetical protein
MELDVNDTHLGNAVLPGVYFRKKNFKNIVRASEES